MFPPSNAQVYFNEAGEPLGWDRLADSQDFYCDTHGFSHAATCEEVEVYYSEKNDE
jgi:hypothetical protein